MTGAGRAKATVTGGGARNTSAADGSRAFEYVPLARVRRWTFLVTNSDEYMSVTNRGNLETFTSPSSHTHAMSQFAKLNLISEFTFIYLRRIALGPVPLCEH